MEGSRNNQHRGLMGRGKIWFMFWVSGRTDTWTGEIVHLQPNGITYHPPIGGGSPRRTMLLMRHGRHLGTGSKTTASAQLWSSRPATPRPPSTPKPPRSKKSQLRSHSPRYYENKGAGRRALEPPSKPSQLPPLPEPKTSPLVLCPRPIHATGSSAAHLHRIRRGPLLVHRPIALVPASLDAVAEDAGRGRGGRQPLTCLVPAVVVDEEDVEGVDLSGDEAEDG